MWLCHMCFSIILWVLSHHLLWGSLNQVSFGIISSILLTGQIKLPRDHAFSWWQSSSVCRWKGQMLVMKWDFLLLWLQCNVSEIQIRVSHQSFLILPSISQWGVIPSRELEALNKILHLWYLGGFFIFLYVSWIFWWEIEGWLTGPSCLVAVTSRNLSPLSSWIFPIPL